jgi:hypothetical protein
VRVEERAGAAGNGEGGEQRQDGTHRGIVPV